MGCDGDNDPAQNWDVDNYTKEGDEVIVTEVIGDISDMDKGSYIEAYDSAQNGDVDTSDLKGDEVIVAESIGDISYVYDSAHNANSSIKVDNSNGDVDTLENNDKMGFKKTDLAERRRKLYFIPVEVVDKGGQSIYDVRTCHQCRMTFRKRSSLHIHNLRTHVKRPKPNPPEVDSNNSVI